MKTLLLVKTSIFGSGGESSRLADAYAERWLARNPDGHVTVRDLASEPVPHLTAERFGAFLAKAEDRTTEQLAVVAYSDALIDELRSADEIVITAPMYNFGIPSGLKAYIDHIARAGVTFRYTANGPVGLLPDKKVHIFATRGGFYSGTPKDTVTQYLKDLLGFVGLTSVDFVYAEGLSISPEQKSNALAQARTYIDAHHAANTLAQVA